METSTLRVDVSQKQAIVVHKAFYFFLFSSTRLITRNVPWYMCCIYGPILFRFLRTCFSGAGDVAYGASEAWHGMEFGIDISETCLRTLREDEKEIGAPGLSENGSYDSLSRPKRKTKKFKSNIK